MLKRIVLSVLLILAGATTTVTVIVPTPAFAHPPQPCSGR
jgi:hypothetical protein